ncbi:MAG: lytic transglycosylase domain-containing protein [Aquificaceae bacterium]
MRQSFHFLLFLTALLFTFNFGFAFYECFFNAGRRYNVDPYLLAAIAKVESNFNQWIVNSNKNGTEDYGIMQINSYWIRTYKIPMQWIRDPCYNIHFGAMVLRRCLDLKGKDIYLAIDCYNKGSKANRNSLYVMKVYESYTKIKKISQ